jgi:hypothetical protein
LLVVPWQGHLRKAALQFKLITDDSKQRTTSKTLAICLLWGQVHEHSTFFSSGQNKEV